MMKVLTVLFTLLFCSIAHAVSANLTWQDNSDNEDGFIVEALSNGEWVEVQRLPSNTTDLDLDITNFDAFRVAAYNAWGVSGYTNELHKDMPNAPGSLKIKKETVTEQITRTTVTEFETE
jgi:hypothetical protein